MFRTRRRVAACALGLGLTLSLLLAAPAAAEKPFNYGGCVSYAVATGGGGRAARAFNETSAPFAPYFRKSNPGPPPGLAGESGSECRTS